MNLSLILHTDETVNWHTLVYVTACRLWPLYQHGLILIPAWISNYLPNKVWDEINYPFPNFKGCTIEVWEWRSNFIPHFIMDVITYSSWD